MDYASSLLGLIPGTSARRTPGLRELLGKVELYLPPEQVARIREAAEFGAQAHLGQKRLSGEPYIAHPVATAEILADLHLDADTIVSAILHDVIEDTPIAKEEIAQRFGADVAGIVDGVTKLDQIQFKSREEAQAESFRKMLLAMVRDLRVIMVKLADRTHNMRTIGSMSLQKRRQVARETLEIYAPVAERLGLYKIKLELEDLGFRALYPQRYRIIERALKRARGNQKEFLGKIGKSLEEAMKKAGIQAVVESREKHLYSVYRKMRRKKSLLSQGGRRVRPAHPGRHLRHLLSRAGRGPRDLPADAGKIQGLHRDSARQWLPVLAYHAVRSQWRADRGADTHQRHAPHCRVRHRGALEIQIRGRHRFHAAGARARLDLAPDGDAGQWQCRGVHRKRQGRSVPDKVYVFTPKGAILRLPRGATVVDFAYAVHTDIGNRCVAAKIDRRLAPLRSVLRNGQTVQIITAKGASPNPSWVNFVATAKARAAIRHYLKSLKRSEALELGRQLLNTALEEFQLNVDRLDPAILEQALREFGFKDRDELLSQIGLGERLAPLVARRLLPSGHDAAGALTPLTIAGAEGLLVSYARCCRPIPDDPIIAFLSAGRGIIIHRDSCANVEDYHKHPEKWQPVAWQANLTRYFSSEIRVESVNRVGMLAAITAAIADTGTNIGHATVEQRDGDVTLMRLEVEVKDRLHLAKLVRTIRRMPDVVRVSRYQASRKNTQGSTEE